MKTLAIAVLLTCAACTPSPPPQPTTASSGASAPTTTASPQAPTTNANADQTPFVRTDGGLSARTWTEAERAQREAATLDLLRKVPNNVPRAELPGATPTSGNRE